MFLLLLLLLLLLLFYVPHNKRNYKWYRKVEKKSGEET